MKETEISTTNKQGEKLAGTECRPDQEKEKYPCVILVHGFGVDRKDGGLWTVESQLLAAAGIMSFRFDFSGRGKSEGNYVDTSLTKQRDELRTILTFVLSQKIVDKTRIGIHAQSLGTAVTISLAPSIQALILMGSVSTPKESLIRLFDKGYNPQGISTRYKEKTKEIIYVNPQFWKDFDNHDLLRNIKKISCPILFIHGNQDDKIPISSMDAYFRAANQPKEKVIIKGADHGMRPHRKKMYKIAVEFFQKHL